MVSANKIKSNKERIEENDKFFFHPIQKTKNEIDL